MTIRQIARPVMRCDGQACEEILDLYPLRADGVELRIEARSRGWSYQPVDRARKTKSADFCPACTKIMKEWPA